VVQKQSANQIRRIEELQGYVRTVDHVKKLVAELEANRAAKPKISVVAATPIRARFFKCLADMFFRLLSLCL